MYEVEIVKKVKNSDNELKVEQYDYSDRSAVSIETYNDYYDVTTGVEITKDQAILLIDTLKSMFKL